MASIQFKKNKAGKRTYYVVFSVSGKHKWIKAGTQKDAKLLKKQLESLNEVKRKEQLGLVSKNKRIDEFFQEYLDNIRLRTSPNTTKRYKAVLNTFLTFLKLFYPNINYLSKIKPEHIESYQQKRLESKELKHASENDNPYCRKNKILPKPQTVNYEVSVLRSVFLRAFERELINIVPTKNVKPLRKAPKKETIILSSKECKLFLQTANRMAKSDNRLKIFAFAFKFLLNTGLRSGELCNLTWNDINIKTSLIKIQAKEGWTPKSYSREFFLNNAAVSVLKKIDKSSHYIFTDFSGKQLTTDKLRRVLIKIMKEMGINNFTRVHDLRHTFNSLMQMAGVDPATMGKILGHKDIETTMIYTHQTQEHLMKSVEKIKI